MQRVPRGGGVSSHACSFVEGALRVWVGTVRVLVNDGLYLRHLLVRVATSDRANHTDAVIAASEADAVGRLANL